MIKLVENAFNSYEMSLAILKIGQLLSRNDGKNVAIIIKNLILYNFVLLYTGSGDAFMVAVQKRERCDITLICDMHTK